MEKKYSVVISACLCGDSCRYDGKSKPNEKIKAIFENGGAIKVCPEQLGGLPTPRTPCEIIGGRVISADGVDRTEEYMLGARKVLEICKTNGITKAILKQNSPSCGSTHVYDGTFSGVLCEGMGKTAELLRKNGIEVLSENDY